MDKKFDIRRNTNNIISKVTKRNIVCLDLNFNSVINEKKCNTIIV